MNIQLTRALTLLLIAASASASAIAAETKTPTADTEAKTYSLFMGADVTITQDGEALPVQDVKDQTLMVLKGGKLQAVRGDRGRIALQIDHGLKLAPLTANLTNVRIEQAFSGMDPQLERMSSTLGVNLYSSMESDEYERQYTEAAELSAMAEAQAQLPFNNSGRMAAAASSLRQESLTGMAQSAQTQNTFDTQIATRVAQEGEFDALRMAFTLSSPVRIANPYIVAVIEYRDARTDRRKNQMTVVGKELDPLGPTPVTVEFKKSGFPPGYEIIKTDIHLYDGGKEIATTASPKRVALSPDEAFQYLVIDYIGSHRGATLPATPFMGNLPPELKSEVAAGRVNDTVYFKVSKDGVPQGAYADQACSREINAPVVKNLLGTLRFKPALNSGKAVDSVLPLKLSKLTM